MRVARTLGVFAGIAFAIACNGATEITVENLEGSWQASTYVYTDKADATRQVDIIPLGASMTLTVAANGTTSSVFNDGQGGTSSDSGTFTAQGQQLTLAGIAYIASLSGSTLTLQSDNGAYDFDSDGTDDPATVTITLTRL